MIIQYKITETTTRTGRWNIVYMADKQISVGLSVCEACGLARYGQTAYTKGFLSKVVVQLQIQLFVVNRN